MEIINKKLTEIKPYEKNPRRNDEAVEYVANSIKEFGFKVPIVIDKDGTIVAGHTRYKASKKLGLKEVPCIVADDLNEEQIKAFRLADNKVGEIAEWDFDLLDDELDDIFDIDMGEFGFDAIEEIKEQEIIEDEVETDNIPKRVETGDIWKLGDHYLGCGDSTDFLWLKTLMQGKKADLVFTDPPYGMKKEKDGVANDNLNYDELLEFNKKWIPLTFALLKDNGSWYCWGIDEPLMDVYSHILKPMMEKNEITFRNLITWDKGSGQGQLSSEFRMFAPADEKCLFVMCGVQGFNNNSDNYFEKWEPIRTYLEAEARKVELNNKKLKEICGVEMYGHWFTKSQWCLIPEEHYLKLQNYFKKEYGAFKKEYDELKKEYYKTRAYFDNTHDNMNNVWHFTRTTGEERELAGGHATPKPIALCARAIKSSSRENEFVLDVFGGSGSTLIACEQLNRVCYVNELDSHWCDVIINRWEKLTGKKAILLEREEK